MRSAHYRLPRPLVAGVALSSAVEAACLVAFALLIMRIVDVVQPYSVSADSHRELVHGLRLVGVLALVSILSAAARATAFTLAERAGYRVVQRLRMTMYAHLQGMAPRQIQHRARGGLLLRFVGDLSMLRMWISRGLLQGSVALLLTLTGVGLLWWLNLGCGLVATVMLVLGAAISLSQGHAMRESTRQMRRRRSLVTGNIDEQINAAHVVQVFGRSAGEYSRLSRQNDSLTTALIRVATLRGRLRGIAAASSMLTTTAVLGMGLFEAWYGRVTVGGVVAALIVTRMLSRPVRMVGLAHDYWQRALVSREKIDDFLRSSSRPLRAEGSERLRVTSGRIEFRDVKVEGALRGVTAEVRPGTVVGITGPIGAGKSTLLNLVCRLVDADSGQVVVDDQDLAAVQLNSVFRKVGVVSPDLPLMRGTVLRNITYSAPEADRQEVARILMASGLMELIGDLPEGLRTWVSEGGKNLSNGQRQRIALARALLGNPPILLLDEPTAGLDEQSRLDFHRMLLRYRGTVLLASHDPAELELTDQVWTLCDGELTEIVDGAEHRERNWQRTRKATWPHLSLT